MLRFFFWILLIVNALLLALNFGFLGKWSGEEREPSRMKLEKNADKIKLMTANAAQDLIDAQTKKVEPALACLELNGFTTADSKSFDEKINSLSLAARLTRTELAEVATNMVYIPSLGSKDAADKKAAQIRKLGFTEFYIVQDQTPMRWAISMGVFKTPEAAKAHLANLQKKGLKEAKLAPRTVSAEKINYRLQDLSPEEKQTVDQIKVAFASVQSHECKAKTE
ncbi:SPOR domain-containing protein [Undibacterium flavidum]|uniref:SPOR domain-containing protein n=1 Tax=Undibacterium flavidum TaxID=2762297 RepID=A0ABR6Y9D2_9BURK|nr:SPOR domain-containing protein [Undibacterium flavidum]MBC3873220.1 SPOR domain-containing protein [Undibacterium flavidum]